MTPEQRARKLEAEGPDIYRGAPIMTRTQEDATCVDEYERANGIDDPEVAAYRRSPADQQRAEWLAWRRGGIGASDVAGILGISPWASPYSVYVDKTTERRDEDPAEHMEFGHRAEPMLAKWFHDRTGLYVLGEQAWCTNPERPWMLCTPDGFVADHEDSVYVADALGIAEWKTTADTVGEWADRVPDHYAAQATWAMAVTGLEHVWFGVLHLAYGRPAFRIYEFHRDEDDERFVVERCEAFWRDHVLAGHPPPTDAHEATTRALAGQWPDASGIALADEHARFAVDQVLWFQAEMDSAKVGLDEAKNELRAVLGDREVLAEGTDMKGKPTGVLATWKRSERKSIDTDALRKAWPDLVRDFERTTPTRTLLVKTPKD